MLDEWWSVCWGGGLGLGLGVNQQEERGKQEKESIKQLRQGHTNATFFLHCVFVLLSLLLLSALSM